jgi:integrase
MGGRNRPESVAGMERNTHLNVASDQDPPIIDRVPRFKLAGEANRARTRTVREDEYGALISGMRRPSQRYVIALYETAMRLSEPQILTWDKIDLKAGLIRLDAADVKENYPRRTPISWELRQVLLEIKEEQKRITNLGRYVFIHKNGQPVKSIRTAFELARKEAKLSNIVPHDIRRTAITRWTELGIPRDLVMAASGHKPANVHDRYLNFTDKQLTDAFKLLSHQKSEICLRPVYTEKRLKTRTPQAIDFILRPDGGIGRHTGLKICLDALSIVLAETPT